MLAIALAAAAIALGPSTSLAITGWTEGRDSGFARTWTLRCAPVGGTLPGAAAACRQLLALRAPFAPVRPRTACTEIYGGPQEALVTGTFRGRRVHARFNRVNGCEIARWDRVAVLFPISVGA